MSETLEESAPPQEEHPHDGVVERPAKLLRWSIMLRVTLDEFDKFKLEEEFPTPLAKETYLQALKEVAETVSPDLQEEMNSIFGGESDSESAPYWKARYAQLVGWLEGIFYALQLTQAISAGRASRSQSLPSGIGSANTPRYGTYL